MEECCEGKRMECCQDKEGECCEMGHMLYAMADDAWCELMIEKMKKIYEEKNGEKMNKVAEVAVEHCMAVWEEKMKAKDMKKEPSKEQIEEYKKKLMEAFMG